MFSEIDADTVEARMERLQELEDFTESCNKKLHSIFKAFGWTRCEAALGSEWEQEVDLVMCPYDPNHRVPKASLRKHKASCRLKKMGYTAEEQAKMADASFCYEETNISTFIMDKATQHEVILEARSAAPLMKMEGVFWQGQYSGEAVEVPQNHKRALCDLTVADRLALYDHVSNFLSNHREETASGSNDDLYVDLVKKMRKDEEQKEPKTHLEVMAEMRDYKRRRQSYRAKNVHITKKSYTEVIREVINVHSEELSRQWKEEEEETLTSAPRSKERSHERELKKKKKKRERESPDEHHERRKKKKKRKRDERDERDGRVRSHDSEGVESAAH